VLSGNIGAAGVSDNVYHVVTGADGATLDGFFVTGGYAQEIDAPRNHGGGMLNDGLVDGITVDNVVFLANEGLYGGGTANVRGTLFQIDSSVFLWNHGSNNGGGVLASWMVSTTNFAAGSITSTTFYGNTGGYGVGAWAMDSRRAGGVVRRHQQRAARQDGGAPAYAADRRTHIRANRRPARSSARAAAGSTPGISSPPRPPCA
jgi:hypothetical protein